MRVKSDEMSAWRERGLSLSFGKEMKSCAFAFIIQDFEAPK